MTGILDLPAELIVNIVTFLDDSSIFNARVSNKYLESSSLSYFGKRFFHKKGYLITSPSLNVLRSIGAHSELRKYVQHVWFNPDCYTNVTPKCAPEEDFDDEGNEIERTDLLSWWDKKQYATYDECVTDHVRLLYSGQLVEELEEAFSTLPNLLTIGMRRSEKYKPWGWRTLMDAVGEDPRVLGPIPSGPQLKLHAPTKLFVALVNALSSSPVELKRLYTDVVEIDNVLAEHLTQESLNRALRSVRYLEINIARAWLNSRPNAQHNPYNTCNNDTDWGHGLVRLMKAMPQLLELGLQIFPDLKQRGAMARRSSRTVGGETATDVGYNYVAFEQLTRNTQLCNLHRVKLEKVNATWQTLKAFLEPSRQTITSLKLRELRLASEKDQMQPWQPIFRFLLDSCPKLDYLLLHHLWHSSGGISFVENPASVIQPPPRAPGPASFVEYDHITLEAKGSDLVQQKLQRVVEQHWYEKALHSYPMDEDVWHTDTSDEEW
jgi:hypothetical protein